MKCPTCDAWTDVLQTSDNRRRRECSNGHRFSTKEIVVVSMPSRNRAIADAVVLKQMTIVDVSVMFSLSDKTGSYVSRCVRKFYPDYHGRSAGQARRWKRYRKQKDKP